VVAPSTSLLLFKTGENLFNAKEMMSQIICGLGIAISCSGSVSKQEMVPSFCEIFPFPTSRHNHQPHTRNTGNDSRLKTMTL
jgi:hypothetical protein